MVDACRNLEKSDPSLFPRSVRVQIPRVLLALYEVRNNRGVGHVGGDVDPNHMDALYVVGSAKWILAELIRLFHDVDTSAAAEIVELLSEREMPIIWEVEGQRRVLHPKLRLKEKMLLLLYSVFGSVDESDLLSWLEQKDASTFRKDVLLPAHKGRLVEYDRENRKVRISPLGARYVEENLPLSI